MYFKQNKAQNNLIIMSKIAPKHLDVGLDRQTGVNSKSNTFLTLMGVGEWGGGGGVT